MRQRITGTWHNSGEKKASILQRLPQINWADVVPCTKHFNIRVCWIQIIFEDFSKPANTLYSHVQKREKAVITISTHRIDSWSHRGCSSCWIRIDFSLWVQLRQHIHTWLERLYTRGEMTDECQNTTHYNSGVRISDATQHKQTYKYRLPQ